MLLKNRYTKVLPPITPKMLKVHHHREKDLEGNICVKGGRTEVTIDTPDYGEITGIAWCTYEDSYTRHVGYAIAFGKATKIWAQLQAGKDVPHCREPEDRVPQHN